MTLALYQVDAFTDRAFAGNPAAVVPLEEPRDERWMQAMAMEMNVSETAFPVRGEPAWGLRWFTPTTEVELCGHATLASAHVLWETGAVPAGEEIRFDSRSGRLVVRRRGEEIEMDFPARPAPAKDAPEGLAEALGGSPVFAGFGNGNWLIELDSEETVRGLEPDFGAMKRHGWAVIVTARGSGDFDFVSRYFAVPYGIDEDPATGSAHCSLAPHWAPRLGRDELRGFQASARGGVFGVRLAGDRVVLRGRAVTVLRGEITPAAFPS